MKRIIKKTKKKAKELGLLEKSFRKYFIAIGGVVIALILFFVLIFPGFGGGLESMSLDEYLVDTKTKEGKFVVFLHSKDNDISNELNNVLVDILDKTGKTYYILDTTDFSAEDTEDINERFVATESGYVVPTLIIIEDNEVVDIQEGYLDQTTLEEFLKSNDVY